MGYVSESLLPGEQVVHQARLHWIIFVKAVLLLVLATLMFAGGRDGVAPAVLFLSLAALVGLWSAMERQTSEFAVTNRRVLVKTGVIRRRSLDINLGKVESLKVDQGILGRLLDFGVIVVKGSGGTPESFRNIGDPLGFRRNVQNQAEQRTRTEGERATPAPSSPSRPERECPHCAEIILAQAKVCKHCGRDIAQTA